MDGLDGWIFGHVEMSSSSHNCICNVEVVFRYVTLEQRTNTNRVFIGEWYMLGPEWDWLCKEAASPGLALQEYRPPEDSLM